ncbi:hypothetical protein [Candidatus Entotheonella palauensis]|uniref:hypothetical protein n=1 Tax=Candidatus Entotheonella palauensis TaxID=93172 RepID=UPI0011774674|nr:hypothetical protein [Candidatus Entotheonella palauensis]
MPAIMSFLFSAVCVIVHLDGDTRSLFEEGSICLGVEETSGHEDVDSPQAMNIDLIKDDQLCDVLYCPPVYFVQLVASANTIATNAFS